MSMRTMPATVSYVHNPEVETRPITYRNVRVITTEQLASAYGVTAKHIQDNHANNRDRFIEGVHYFKVVGEELKAFREQPDFFGLQISTMARHLILWTERGARRHAKILDNDVAWSVFEELEDTYFAVKEEQIAGPSRSQARLPSPNAVFRDYLKTMKLIGFSPAEAALAANRGAVAETGTDVLENAGIKALGAPGGSPHLSPSEIGVELAALTGGTALSGKKVNDLLMRHGFQEKGATDATPWVPTPKGDQFKHWTTTGKKHRDGSSVNWLRWQSGIVQALAADMAAALPTDSTQH